ncbi:MAG: acylphosphatase [Nitrososphaerota archaeon]
MPLLAKKLAVSGRVQRVGYRRFVLDTALSLGIVGYAKNEPDGTVSIFAQGEAAKIEEFIKRISKPKQPAVVNQIVQTDAVEDLKLKHFRIKFGSIAEELQEGFGSMEVQFNDYRQEFRGFHDEFNDYRQEFRDYRQEFRGFHDEFNDYRQEFRDYREEFRDYRQEFRDFASRTDENFKNLNEKYGEISAKLTQILETLQRQGESLQKELADTRKDLARAVDNLSRLIDIYISKLNDGQTQNHE